MPGMVYFDWVKRGWNDLDFLSAITCKKFGNALTTAQIEDFARAAAEGLVPDYQLAAMLMAIRLNGMDARETADLTMAMARSGEMLDPDVGGIPVDKHSTGGVGDTTTLVLAPLVASCGGKVLKMSGRGLGHTGGTIDKLESIPGMQVSLPKERFVEIVRTVGCAVVGQSAELAPADKRLYALRDVTSTVDSIPLIAASILSKKFASGARALVLDVKYGSGAIMDTLEKSVQLAQTMVDIGTHAGRHVTAVLTGMEEPLGTHVGNALEVKEAIDILAGRAQGDLLKVSVYLGAQMLCASGVTAGMDEAERRLRDAIGSGAGLRKLAEMIEAQGGDPRVTEDLSLLPQAPVIREVTAARSGCVVRMDTAQLGYTAQALGAGRRTKDDVIDPAVGFVMRVRLGDKVRAGDPLAVVYARKEDDLAQAEQSLRSAVHISDGLPDSHPLIYAVVNREGTSYLS